MLELNKKQIEDFLRQSLGSDVRLTGLGEIGSLDEQGMKDFGYGKPLLVHYEQAGNKAQAVLSVMRGDKYGHQFYWDRAAVLMFQHDAGERLAKHVRSLGLGYVDGAGRLNPLQAPREFVILNEKLEGKDYFLDLERIRHGDFRPEDERMARNFARWLAEAHDRKLDDPDLYHRRIRDLIGHSECIFGLVDGYPHPYEHFLPGRFQALEKRLVDWRWKLKDYTHRLCAVHGDFHPWNVLVREDGDFSVLDRSRGEWGDAADDVSTMSCNYLLFGLYDQPRLSGSFEKLYLTFWEEYLGRTNDREMLDVIAPFYVFRSLVIASPEWYPNHPLEVRAGLFRFMENVLADKRFAYDQINKYMS
ncbi:MAG TPA: aminoglycoside phosphotransferase family protein [Desulfonatronum sp.]|nr:aminoglycoside phosphotransferase family protein [Desulfonatronum sp.]